MSAAFSLRSVSARHCQSVTHFPSFGFVSVLPGYYFASLAFKACTRRSENRCAYVEKKKNEALKLWFGKDKLFILKLYSVGALLETNIMSEVSFSTQEN